MVPPLPRLFSTISTLWTTLLILQWWIHGSAADTEVVWHAEDCDVTEYYNEVQEEMSSSISSPSRHALQALLERTHRRILPYTAANSNKDEDDVWKALYDLDGNATADAIHLIYAAQNMLSNATALQGQTTGWNREHLWPQSRGVANIPAALTDIHHLVPSDWNVNAARSNKWFGDACDRTVAACRIPAHAQAAADTAASATTFLPPVAARGRIARALLYMDLRYGSSGNDNGVNFLQLGDCLAAAIDNDDESNVMGFRAQLLAWHALYPVTDAERQRNARACTRWQGNRNPLVDFPHWVTPLFGPATLTVCHNTTDTNTDNIDNTSFNTTCPNVGSILFVAVNTDNPDDIALVTLANLSAGTTLYVTDNAFDGESLASNEGVQSLHISNNVLAGTVLVGLDPWENVRGSLALSASGETLLLYCLDENDDAGQQIVHWITGISLAGPWQTTGDASDNNENGRSGLPATLRQAALALNHVDNARYVGPTAGTVKFLQTAILQPNHWQGRDSERFEWDVSSWKFQIKSSASMRPFWCWSCLVLILLCFW